MRCFAELLRKQYVTDRILLTPLRGVLAAWSSIPSAAAAAVVFCCSQTRVLWTPQQHVQLIFCTIHIVQVVIEPNCADLSPDRQCAHRCRYSQLGLQPPGARTGSGLPPRGLGGPPGGGGSSALQNAQAALQNAAGSLQPGGSSLSSYDAMGGVAHSGTAGLGQNTAVCCSFFCSRQCP